MADNSVKRKKSRRKPLYTNIVAFPLIPKGKLSRTRIFTCSCGGQTFSLCENGKAVCYSCRTVNKMIKFVIVA